VLVLSSKAQSSQWVSREIDLAINEGKIVLPFMLENCALKDDFNFYLTNVQRYSAYENKVAAMEQMVKEIKAIIGLTQKETASEPIVNTPPVVDKSNERKPKEQKPKEKKIKQTKKEAKIDYFCILSGVCAVISVIASFGMYIIPNLLAMLFAYLGLKNIEKNQTNGKILAMVSVIVAMACNLIGLLVLLGAIGLVIAIAINVVFGIIFFKKYKTL
jgi:hypothetical protein